MTNSYRVPAYKNASIDHGFEFRFNIKLNQSEPAQYLSHNNPIIIIKVPFLYF